MKEKGTALIPIWGLRDAHPVAGHRLVESTIIPLQSDHSASKWPCRTGSSFCWIGEDGREKAGEKGLQDKGSASLALLSVCLHIILSRDTVSLEGDRLMRNGRNSTFLSPNREQYPRSPSYLRTAAIGPLFGTLLP
jgi:hypothetical protein